MNFWKSVAGTYHVEITAASPADTLTAINAAGVLLFDVSFVDELTVTGSLYRHDYKLLKALLDRRGEVVKIIKKEGLFWTLFSLKGRPVLLTGFILFFALALYMPSRVLFVRVEGNTTVPTRLIIERAEECGIGFGTSRRLVRSEKMKNALLSAVPELQWAGVNTYGCVAVISVQERSIADQKQPQKGVASIVAKEDGIISEMTVIRGNPLCRVGQAVKAGQMLVSGYTDCGLSIKAEVAEAEIFAQTRHDLEVVTPANYQKTEELQPLEKRYYLQIGKKLINFAKDSGISSTTCVKMYKENYLKLPGGFQLPIALITEEWFSRSLKTKAADEDSFLRLEDYANAYLKSQMLAGKILQSDFSVQQNEDTYNVIGKFACLEMIGQVRSEEIIQGNGKRD